MEWRKVIPVLLAVFVLGAAAGSWAQRMRGPRHKLLPPPPARVVARLDREVQFDDSQRAAVLALLEKRRPEAEALKKETVEKIGAMRRSVHAEIRALLRPDQQAKLDAFAERMEARRSKKRAPPGE